MFTASACYVNCNLASKCCFVSEAPPPKIAKIEPAHPPVPPAHPPPGRFYNMYNVQKYKFKKYLMESVL